MKKEDIEKYSIEDVLEILTDLGNKLNDSDILVQCYFYRDLLLVSGKEFNLFRKMTFYDWVIKVIETNNLEFERMLRGKKIKKINLHLDHTDY